MKNLHFNMKFTCICVPMSDFRTIKTHACPAEFVTQNFPAFAIVAPVTSNLSLSDTSKSRPNHVQITVGGDCIVWTLPAAVLKTTSAQHLASPGLVRTAMERTGGPSPHGPSNAAVRVC